MCFGDIYQKNTILDYLTMILDYLTMMSPFRFLRP